MLHLKRSLKMTARVNELLNGLIGHITILKVAPLHSEPSHLHYLIGTVLAVYVLVCFVLKTNMQINPL